MPGITAPGAIAAQRSYGPLIWDVIAALIGFGVVLVLGETSASLVEPLKELELAPVALDPSHLPAYAARTTLRMLVALALSLLFTFTYATLAAKSRRAELLLVPLLDILQSVPILGFISVTVVFFMSLAPGKVLGAEFAAIFAIFTSQAWNMAFSFYQSLRTVPRDLDEAAQSMRLTAWMKFWRLEVPFATPGLVWNMMMSMSRMVFCGRFRSHQRRQHHGDSARHRLLYCARHREARSFRGRVGDRHYGDRNPNLRSTAVPPAGGLGGSVSARAAARCRPANVVGLDSVPAVKSRPSRAAAADQTVGGDVPA